MRARFSGLPAIPAGGFNPSRRGRNLRPLFSLCLCASV
ncbi:MAG: hypothetical protein AVDCRST_MAG68-2178 [uncultured Gemmatimonadetes bacterium]|uniref:Uncharacterized protein n=1 Tax=uncultured Gemmatimonadota bacterium TaxID=203437 RepID=A0A6J4L9X9_9BACT|nr:MAG: hypothetical protein AVDCRST_MAG68-2178 [uncultured Gemmatimonadota bacterium]